MGLATFTTSSTISPVLWARLLLWISTMIQNEDRLMKMPLRRYRGEDEWKFHNLPLFLPQDEMFAPNNCYLSPFLQGNRRLRRTRDWSPPNFGPFIIFQVLRSTLTLVRKGIINTILVFWATQELLQMSESARRIIGITSQLTNETVDTDGEHSTAHDLAATSQEYFVDLTVSPICEC